MPGDARSRMARRMMQEFPGAKYAQCKRIVIEAQEKGLIGHVGRLEEQDVAIAVLKEHYEFKEKPDAATQT